MVNLMRVLPLAVVALLLGKYLNLGNEPLNLSVSFVVIVVLAVLLGYATRSMNATK